MGLGANNTVLAVGGIQAYLSGQPDVNFFNVTDAASPVWFASADPPLVRRKHTSELEEAVAAAP